MKLRNSLLVLLATAAVTGSKAQVDPHFTQYYAYPGWLNPALTGTMDGDYRATAIYRSQWGNIASPYTTTGVSADMTTEKHINLGLNLLQQQAGDGGYKYRTGYLSVSYTGIRFGYAGQHRLLAGIQVGFLNRSFNPASFKMGDQWTPVTGYNPGVATTDQLSTNSSTVLDAGAGVMYYNSNPGQTVNLFGGFSAFHLTRPQDKFAGSSATSYTIPVRYSLHAGARIVVSDILEITPHAIYTRQGNAAEKVVGVYGQAVVNETTDFLLGMNYRIQDAFSPYAGVKYNRLLISAGYDINSSQLSSMASGSNSFEISLTITGAKPQTSPEFKCPRL